MNKVVTCKFCNQETAVAKGCGGNPVIGHNQRWSRIPYGHEVEGKALVKPNLPKVEGDCPGCNVVKAAFHHAYCPIEECPRCNGKMNICQCFYTLKEE